MRVLTALMEQRHTKMMAHHQLGHPEPDSVYIGNEDWMELCADPDIRPYICTLRGVVEKIAGLQIHRVAEPRHLRVV